MCIYNLIQMITDAELIKYISEHQGKVMTKELKEKFYIDNLRLLRLMREKKICWFPIEGKLYVWLHFQYIDVEDKNPDAGCPCNQSSKSNCARCQDLPSWY